MDDNIIQVNRENRIAVITLNRPERLNAISRETISAVTAFLKGSEEDEDVAVVILRGAGRAFSAGMDLKEDAAAGVSGKDGWRRVLSEDLD